ncbi:CHY zinc finger [Desulfocurvibacter africanus PCS]|uniref:CHY zinc finger n=1 Tax=Desulfocurvibacter africanus PCS TaxID=1262666 RepID=M5Q0D0_DESAF|nr:hypothetical protein [Desulfocurvibacter africanus]EMG36596.1 CHY zinc finger [Desulfocurvibacter africanus PCS]
MPRIFECTACHNRDQEQMVTASIGPVLCKCCGSEQIVEVDTSEERMETMAQRLDSLEHMVMRQQKALNDHASEISELRRRVKNMEMADALFGSDGKDHVQS